MSRYAKHHLNFKVKFSDPGDLGGCFWRGNSLWGERPREAEEGAQEEGWGPGMPRVWKAQGVVGRLITFICLIITAVIFLFGCCILSISAAVSCVLTTILVFAAPGPRALIPRAPNDTDGSHYCLWMRGHEIYRGCGVPPTNIIPWPYGLEGCKMR